MKSFKIKIQYVGTRYNGWQVQRGSENVQTIQGLIEAKMLELTGTSVKRLMASGRTDTGVHANEQVLRMDLNRDFPVETITKGLNGILPDDINIVSAEECAEDFHPVVQAQNKEYRYFFKFKKPHAFYDPFITTFKAEEPSLERLQELASIFVGKHDFANYMCVGTPVSTTVRTIFESEISLVDFSLPLCHPEQVYMYRVVGSGFLKQMVRLLVGSIVYCATRGLEMAVIEESLTNMDFRRPWFVAPAKGLVLHSVQYPA